MTLGRVEVLDVQLRRDPRVLVLGLDARGSRRARGRSSAPLRRKCHQPERQQPAVHLPQHLVDVGHARWPRPTVSPSGGLGDHEPVRVEDELEVRRVGVEVLSSSTGRSPSSRSRPRCRPRRSGRGRAAAVGATSCAGGCRGAARPRPASSKMIGRIVSRSATSSVPHEQVHRLGQPGLLAAAAGSSDGCQGCRIIGSALEALDQHAALVVHREVDRADHVGRARARAASRRRRRAARGSTSGSSSSSRKPNMPQRLLVEGVEVVVVLGRDAPDHALAATGEEQLRVAVREERVQPPVEEQPALQAQRRHPDGRSRVQPVRQLDELPPVPPRADGADDDWHLTPPDRTLYAHGDRRLREGPRPRAGRAAARGARGRPAALLPPLESPAAPGGRDGGRRADHARLQQLPRADRRPARHRGRARRARALRHRADRLAPAQRHDRPAPRARARAGGVDGHRGRDRLHHRPPGQRRRARHAARARATR